MVISVFLCGNQIKEKDLPPQYRDWLKLVNYIIRPEEKDVFLQLVNDRERDIFIQTFWKQRDPTPGTPENEYKQEHTKRFNYANEYFRRGSPREGWMTDMGRFHIILGPPVSIERFDNQKGLYPAQVWYYYGEKEKGLPTHFGIVFFKRGGAGEYKLYAPVSDGPGTLMIEGRNLDPFAYEQTYEKLYELAPTLALVSLSMIPGDIPFNYQPSPRNNIIIADILESPKQDINPAYATHFLNLRGIVSTDYLTNYIESDAEAALMKDPMIGLNFLHFLIVPQKISVDYYEPKDQFFCNFTLNVNMSEGEKTIFQYSKEFPFYFSQEELDKIKASGLAIEDSFPVAEGKYKLTILLMNSVGKEFTIYEREMDIPERSAESYLMGPFLGYRFQSYGKDVHIPFKALESKLAMEPKKTYSATDSLSILFLVDNVDQNLWESGKIELLIQGLKESNPTEKNWTLLLKNAPFRKILKMTYVISTGELSPDYYDIYLRLIGAEGDIIDTQSDHFVLSSAEAVAHPTAYAKGIPLAHSYAYYYMLASQYRKTGRLEKADVFYGKAMEMNPGYARGLLEYAQFLFESRKFVECLELIEKIEDNKDLQFNYFLIKGRAHMALEEYNQAIANLEEGNRIYNSDTTILNSLGFCYHQTNQRQKALDVLKASLRLNPQQEDIKKLIQKIEENKFNKLNI
ncbi:MAG: GWxTD domain-containing protein [Candidatus Aminicenantes bacterium]|nr:MAG: GWxTD domain-containing protein [Candidatus Aminicenantes bacterium]